MKTFTTILTIALLLIGSLYLMDLAMGSGKYSIPGMSLFLIAIALFVEAAASLLFKHRPQPRKEDSREIGSRRNLLVLQIETSELTAYGSDPAIKTFLGEMQTLKSLKDPQAIANALTPIKDRYEWLQANLAAKKELLSFAKQILQGELLAYHQIIDEVDRLLISMDNVDAMGLKENFMDLYPQAIRWHEEVRLEVAGREDKEKA